MFKDTFDKLKNLDFSGIKSLFSEEGDSGLMGIPFVSAKKQKLVMLVLKTKDDKLPDEDDLQVYLDKMKGSSKAKKKAYIRVVLKSFIKAVNSKWTKWDEFDSAIRGVHSEAEELKDELVNFPKINKVFMRDFNALIDAMEKDLGEGYSTLTFKARIIEILDKVEARVKTY